MHDFDEAFYMLDGELVFQIDGERFTRRAGEFAFAPRNVTHALADHSQADARYLLVCTPAGLERHFARGAAASQGVAPPDWALQPSPEIVVVGPGSTRGRQRRTRRHSVPTLTQDGPARSPGTDA
jgi:hypothetical protein